MTVNRRLPLNQTMGFEERNTTQNSVVNSKWLDYAGALFPRVDIEDAALTGGFEIAKLIPGDKAWAVGEDTTDTISFYTITNGSSFGVTRRGGSSAGGSFKDARFFNDGVGDYIYGLDSTGDVWKFETDTYTFTDNVATLGSSGEQLVSDHPLIKKLFYITDYNLYPQTGATVGASALVLDPNFTYKAMFPYKEYLVIIAEATGGGVYAMFYNIVTDTGALTDIVKISGGEYTHAGVLSGSLYTITHLPFYQNNKAYEGIISYRKFNGASFREINKIPTVESSIITAAFNSDDGNNFYVGIDTDEDNRVGVYRFNESGGITISSTLSDTTTGSGKIDSVMFRNGYVTLGYKDDAGDFNIGQIFDGSSTYADFREPAVYITPFVEDPYEEKDMTSVYMSFTEADANEEGQVYYRTKRTDAWTLILDYDQSEHGVDDRKQIVYNNTNNLPRFKEIQFKIVSDKGLNITSVGYKFDYVDTDHE